MSVPSVTVKDIWRSVLPEGTELLAGGTGLERRVEWACALRTRPPAFDALKGGEMAFIPVRSIRLLDERLDLAQVMSGLADKGGVAAAVSGDVSRQSIEVAERLMMPLLRLPEETQIADVHQVCVRFILDQRTFLHERAQQLQTALMQLALSGAGPAAIVDRLAEETGLRAFWLDESGELQHASDAAAAALRDTVAAQVPALARWGDTVTLVAADPPVRELPLPGAQQLLASPIPSRRGVGGFLIVAGAARSTDQVARLAVSRAAAACSIELDRERAVIETQERLEGELVESLISGAYASEEAVLERARRLGVDLGGRVAVFVVRGARGGDPAWEETAVRAVRAALERRGARALVSLHHGGVAGVVALDPNHGEAAVEHLAAAARDACASATRDPRTSAGAGRPGQGAHAVAASHREAEHALGLGRAVLGQGRTSSFGALGLHRLLFTMAQQAEMLEFFESVAGPLVAYDGRTGGDLMRTLDAYFACHGSPTETAQKLGLHRNTVLYRLRRVEEVGNLSLDDPATRLNLHLCLRIRDVLQLSGAARGVRREAPSPAGGGPAGRAPG